jgi:ERCC4-related helicase
LKENGIDSEVVTGEMSLEEQATKFKEFKKGFYNVLISTVGVGGAGVDLPNADVVIQYGLSTSPFQMEQRKGRIRGGTEKCLVYKHTREDEKFNELQTNLQRIGEKVEKLSADPALYRTYKGLIELLFVSKY